MRFLCDAAQKSVTIDVRTPGEMKALPLKKEGVLKIPVQNLVERLSELPADHEVPILLFCGGTSRLSLAKAFLEQAGYIDVRIHPESAAVRLE